jgi:uncharacterized lipoprotein YbaY
MKSEWVTTLLIFTGHRNRRLTLALCKAAHVIDAPDNPSKAWARERVARTGLNTPFSFLRS